MNTRKLSSIPGNSQKLDGGAMFGNAPKPLWQKWVRVDDLNRIDLACRCLLVEESSDQGTRRILLETGIGAFFAPELRERYGVQEKDHRLLAGLSELGLSDADIDIVILSHLHFDHAGGLLKEYTEGRPPALLFPKARFLVSRKAWERARSPHPRDRASFVPELQELLEASGRMEIVEGNSSPLLGEGYKFHYSDGHTPGLLLTEITMPDGPVVFMGDLVPGTPWVHLPITMGYDRAAELLIDEKTALLTDLYARKGRLFYTHDASTALSGITRDERGRFSAKEPIAAIRSLER